MMGTLYNSSYQFVQTDDYVVISVEMAHDARIIPIFDSGRGGRGPICGRIRISLGSAIPAAGMKGDALVVETVNINDLQISESSVPISSDGRIIERFTRYSDTEIVYTFTVEGRQSLQPALDRRIELSRHGRKPVRVRLPRR